MSENTQIDICHDGIKWTQLYFSKLFRLGKGKDGEEFGRDEGERRLEEEGQAGVQPSEAAKEI